MTSSGLHPRLNHMNRLNHGRAARRGSVIIIVLWAIAVAAIITSSVQLFSQRQVTMSRESLERVQARWAARAGIENTMAVMKYDSEHPQPDDAKLLTRDMYGVRRGSFIGASYDILHQTGGVTFGGPMDEHSKLNINRQEDRSLLAALDDLTPDVAAAINDWLDEDNDITPLGVERDYYQSLASPYLPRNGPMRSIGEMELVAGIWPKYFRGEDWNLNGRLDPNENDGSRSFPPDNADNALDADWSAKLTVYSVGDGPTASGKPRLLLKRATADELVERLEITPSQAQALITYGKTPTNSLVDLIYTPLTGAGGASAANANTSGPNNNNQNQNQNQNQSQPSGATSQPGQGSGALTDAQIRAILDETAIDDPLDRLPGKMNINTVPGDYIRDLLVAAGMDEGVADDLVYFRDSQTSGITSLVDLKKIPKITNDQLRTICHRFDVSSNVFTISSRGVSQASHTQCEIIAVVDRSTIPIRIIEYREQ